MLVGSRNASQFLVYAGSNDGSNYLPASTTLPSNSCAVRSKWETARCQVQLLVKVIVGLANRSAHKMDDRGETSSLRPPMRETLDSSGNKGSIEVLLNERSIATNVCADKGNTISIGPRRERPRHIPLPWAE